MVDAYWKFDNDQQPISSWHDKQDLLKALEELLQPAVSNSVCEFGLNPDNCIRKADTCFKCLPIK